MEMLAPALHITISFCGLPLLLIASLTMLIFALLRHSPGRRKRKQGKRFTIKMGILYYLASLVICSVLTLLGNWVYLMAATENTQGF